MKEESVLMSHALRRKTQSVSDSLPNFFGVLPVPLVGNAERTQPKTCSRNAGHLPVIRAVGLTAVLDQTRGRIHGLPEKSERGFLNFLKKMVLLAGEVVLRRVVAEELGRKTRVRTGRGHKLNGS